MLVILLVLAFIVMLFVACAITHAGSVADQKLEEYYRQMKEAGIDIKERDNDQSD